jgi:hypothetical protein
MLLYFIYLFRKCFFVFFDNKYKALKQIIWHSPWIKSLLLNYKYFSLYHCVVYLLTFCLRFDRYAMDHILPQKGSLRFLLLAFGVESVVWQYFNCHRRYYSLFDDYFWTDLVICSSSKVRMNKLVKSVYSLSWIIKTLAMVISWEKRFTNLFTFNTIRLYLYEKTYSLTYQIINIYYKRQILFKLIASYICFVYINRELKHVYAFETCLE